MAVVAFAGNHRLAGLHGSRMMHRVRHILVFAGTLLLLLSGPFSAQADDLNSLASVGHGGAVVQAGDTITRDDISLITSFWNFNFTWPHSVSNSRALLVIVRGTFGDIEGGTPQSGVNYGATFQSWPAGAVSISKSLSLPPLGNLTTPSGTYTAFVAELTTSGTAEVIDQTMDWFASGGTLGLAPAHHALLTFTYEAVNTPEELSGALQSVSHGGRTIFEGDEVLREEISESENNAWGFTFDWPNSVPNQQALFMVFRGTFGNLDGGSAIANVNYSLNFQTWPAGHNVIGKQFGLPLLRDSNTPPGMYTLMVAERNPTYLSEGIQPQVDWFASGGTEGIPPKKYALLTFHYKKYKDCCSSVIFLPGFEGSVLKADNGANTLWPPDKLGTDADLKLLQLDHSGSSTTQGIFVEGIVENFHGVPIYSEFRAFMNTLVPDTMREWYPLAYDWRFSPQEIITDGIETSRGHVDALALIEQIAERSDTGQVTFVAHSNGGLLGKALIKALEDANKDHLIDSFVMVGSPQLGTARAVGGMLHGEGSSIGTWYYTLVSKAQARALAENMESAYNLIPSRAYFNHVTDPPVVFDENAGYTDPWRADWGQAIGNYTELFEFLTDAFDTRDEPAFGNTRFPETLHTDLLANVDTFHQEFDAYVIPGTIRVVQVAGWGLDTIKAIDYVEYEFFDDPYYIPQMTVEGDSTVVYPSALASYGEKYFLVMDDYNRLNASFFTHTDILNIDEIQKIIKVVINEDVVVENSFITSNKPPVDNTEDKLLVAVHSPLTLSVHDNQQEKFSGVDPNNDQNWGIQFVKTEIPNSVYFHYGEGKYLIVPDSGDYSFEFEGTDIGTATVVLQEIVNDMPATVARFSHIAVSGTFKATLAISTTTEEFLLEADADGDGIVDMIIVPDRTELTFAELITLLRGKIGALNIDEGTKNSLLNRVDQIENFIQKGSEKTDKRTTSSGKLIAKKGEQEKIDNEDVQEILNLLTQIESQL